jgi:hypothetical protein
MPRVIRWAAVAVLLIASVSVAGADQPSAAITKSVRQPDALAFSGHTAMPCTPYKTARTPHGVCFPGSSELSPFHKPR